MGWRATVVAVQAVPARDLKTAMARIRPDEPAGLWAGVVSEPAACSDRAKPFTRARAAGQLATKITREKASGAQHQGQHRQNSLPSGSARTYQLWSPWPTSTCRAPRASSRSSSACWSRLTGLTSRCSRFLAGFGPSGRTGSRSRTGSCNPDRHAIAAAVHNLPAQRSGPELREQLGVRRVDDQGSDPVFHVLVLAHRGRNSQTPAPDPGTNGTRTASELLTKITRK